MQNTTLMHQHGGDLDAIERKYHIPKKEILDFSGNLYGQTVRMEFYKRLRGERKFDSLEELKKEVMRNAEQTRAYFDGL